MSEWPRSRGGAWGVVDRMRRRGERALDAGMGHEQAAVARGMVLGEDERIDPLLRDDFRRSGLAHVLAVSGQNVMLLCALATPLLAAAGAGPRVRLTATLAVTPRGGGDPGREFSFAAVAGTLPRDPPLRRAQRALPHLLAEGLAVT